MAAGIIHLTYLSSQAHNNMKKILISWIGKHDINAAESGQLGPVLAAIIDAENKNTPYDAIHLLCNYPSEALHSYVVWLKEKNLGEVPITSYQVPLSSPMAYEEIYPVVSNQLSQLHTTYPDYQRVVHLSPGTPAMTAIWLLLVKTKYPSVCIESWRDNTGTQHVHTRELPFQISAEFTLEAFRNASQRLEHIEGGTPSFDGVTGNSKAMQVVQQRAEKMAVRDVPVLILGETGTGKEVLAKAIHKTSLRQSARFIAVNCGALPEDLAESLLFGHKKGAFTGAHKDHTGFFERADGGTLFLDEIGELSPLLQTKLLRVLQEKEFTPVGSEKLTKSDFRLISATHQNLTDFIEEGRFREDLFYRIAIGIIKLPPVRDRGDDIRLLANTMLHQINEDLADQPDYCKKTLTSKAHIFISRQPWLGNVRELNASLLRAAIWTDSDQICENDIEASLISRKSASQHLPDYLNGGVDLNDIVGKVASHYIFLALKETHGNKAAAARLLGFKSSQVLTNWITKYAVDEYS